MPEATTHPRRVSVVPHTHWDREWYRTFESYRVRLLDTLDRVLDAQLPYFLLDGQTAVIDDYLALRPERLTTLRERVRAGRLGVGPWFVLPDEFLVSGEALVRNLTLGRAGMRALGAEGEGVGYLPDMFGHVAQMPQLLAQFGCDMAVVWRGVHPGQPRFSWIGPDGTALPTAWLPLGYYQTMFMEQLPVEERRKGLQTYMDAFSEADAVWLLAGADHMAPRADLTALLGSVQEGLPGSVLELSSLRDALLGPAPRCEVHGELRDPSKAYILPGVLSTRTALKQANVACQTLLERYVEPLTALSPRPYPRALVQHAWRQLLLNHPHDSICGCSIDQVHREMWPRFAAVEQVGEELLAVAVGSYDKPVAEPGVFFFNPTGTPWTGWLDVEVLWPREGAPEAVTIEGALAVHARGHEDTEVFRAGIDFNPDWFPVRRYRLAVQVALPGLGGLRARAVAGSPAEVVKAVSVSPERLENEHVKLLVEDGQLVLHGATGERLVLGFQSEPDAGDSYNFSPLADQPLYKATLEGTRVVSSEPHQAVLEATHELELPVGLAADRSGPDARTVILSLRSRFTLQAGARAVSVETSLDNTARDHRLRLTLRGQDDPRVLAEGAFGLFERAFVPAPALPVAKGTEAVMPEFPTAGVTILGDVAIAAPGLHEAARLDEHTLALTMLRCVGWLSRDDLRTRGGGAGPRFETPEAQCQGVQTFRYTLITGGDLFAAGQQALAPPRWWLAEGLVLPGLALDERLVVTSLSRSGDDQALLLRAYNPGTEAVSVAAPGVRVRLDETPLPDVAPGEVGPSRIATWRVKR